MKRYYIRLFVRLSVLAWAHSSKPHAAGVLVIDAVGPMGRRY